MNPLSNRLYTQTIHSTEEVRIANDKKQQQLRMTKGEPNIEPQNKYIHTHTCTAYISCNQDQGFWYREEGKQVAYIMNQRETWMNLSPGQSEYMWILYSKRVCKLSYVHTYHKLNLRPTPLNTECVIECESNVHCVEQKKNERKTEWMYKKNTKKIE